MEKITFRRGRPGIPLSDEDRLFLAEIIKFENITVTDLAYRIGISHSMLNGPLSGNRRCSPESYRKIMQFIQRIRKAKSA